MTATANLVARVCKLKLNIEQSAHSIQSPLAAWWRGAGWRWWDMFAAIHLSYFHPHCEQGTEPESGSRPAASCQAAAGGQDQSCGQQQHNHKIATTRYCLQHSQHRNTAHHDQPIHFIGNREQHSGIDSQIRSRQLDNLMVTQIVDIQLDSQTKRYITTGPATSSGSGPWLCSAQQRSGLFSIMGGWCHHRNKH